MKFFSFLSAAALTCTSVIAHPVFHDEQSSPLGKRQQANVALVQPGGTVYPRLEIRQLKDGFPNQWTLLVLATQAYMKRSANDQTSYFAISGIHGVPRTNYNNVGQCGSCGGTDGYCTHDSVLFPGWHRAYVALFEQEFKKIAINIANQYPAGNTRTTMVNAANQLRWPYWDWAAHPPQGRPVLPAIITDVTISVNGPNGQVSLTNPFFRYDFKNGENSQMFYGPFTTWQRTYRYPNSNDANAASDTQQCANAFANIRQSMQDQIYGLFTNCHDYAHFSNDDAGSSSTSCSSSLEGIHNTIHNTAGGGGSNGVSGGHMTYLPLAAFDPIFWLHHSNVDRIFAMWQTLNSGAYGASQTAPHNTWTIAQGSTQNADSPLTPFKDGNGNFWTTNRVRDWRIFGYTYPEYAHSAGDRAAISNYVNRLYGPNANAVAGSSKRDAAPEALDLASTVSNAVNNAVPAAYNSVAGTVKDILSTNPLAASNGSTYEYVANINTCRYCLNGTYTVYVFNQKPASEDPTTWITDKNLIGPFGVMSMPNMVDNNMVIAGSIPLTTSLKSTLAGGLLSSLADALVVPYLTKHLEWRVAQEGKSIDPSTIPGFSVLVASSTAKPPASQDELPVYSTFVELLGVTKGQAGGANSTQAGTAPAYGQKLKLKDCE